jgi:hypothetical protein
MSKIRDDESNRVRDIRYGPAPKPERKPLPKITGTLGKGMSISDKGMERAGNIGRQRGSDHAQVSRSNQAWRENRRKMEAQAYSNDRAQHNRATNVWREAKKGYTKAMVGRQAGYDKVQQGRSRNRLMVLAKNRLQRGG